MTVVGVIVASAYASGAPRQAAAAADAESSIEIIDATSLRLADLVRPPTTAEPQYIPVDLITDTTWVIQTGTEPDPSTNPAVNLLTGRTSFMLDAAVGADLTTLRSATCVAGRAANPSSDHPSGRACDFMFDYRTPAGVEAGWRAADWLVANQAVLGVKYVIWQGLIWNAGRTVNPWSTYTSTAYGCPNPANATGCHYDHVHVSMY